jgi:hypothetical protein
VFDGGVVPRLGAQVSRTIKSPEFAPVTSNGWLIASAAVPVFVTVML